MKRLFLLAYFFNKDIREKRDLTADTRQFKRLEILHRQAMADNRLEKAALITGEIEKIRSEYRFVSKCQ